MIFAVMNAICVIVCICIEINGEGMISGYNGFLSIGFLL